jgi:AraC family transcriptional regulator, regulatory protein of adaptative response / DNA-3-methyladenine glycosylase II
VFARDGYAFGAPYGVLAAQHSCAAEHPSRTHAAASRVTGRPADAEIVCRGIQLILDGGLDDDKGERLAARLGVSQRQLRRLFQIHAGITPDQFAQSSRAHFARRMLDETDLPMTDIAFVSGFGSLRQFDRTMSANFGMTPLTLRSRRRRGDCPSPDGSLAVRLGSCTAFDWEAMLAHLGTQAIRGVEDIDGRMYRRTIVTERAVGALEIHRGESGELFMRARLADWRDLLHVIQRARCIFNLEGDPDAETGGHRAHALVRPPGTWDPFEVGVRAIIGQERSAGEATAIASQLVERHGQRAAAFSDWGLTHTFPPATVLASNRLDGIGLTPSESATLGIFAEATAHGNGVVESLLTIPGVDPATAYYVASRVGATDP